MLSRISLILSALVVVAFGVLSGCVTPSAPSANSNSFVTSEPLIAHTDFITPAEGSTDITIAIEPFKSDPGIDLNTSIADTVSENLTRSGRFKIVPFDTLFPLPRAFSESPESKLFAPDIDLILRGRVVQKGTLLQVEMRLFGSSGAQVKNLISRKWPKVRREQLRIMSHDLSDYVYQAVLGKSGSFNSSLFYVQSSLNAGQHLMSIAASGYDGKDRQYAFQTNRPIYEIGVSQDREFMAFSHVGIKANELSIQSTSKGTKFVLAQNEEGIRSPAWSPDGRYLAVSFEKDENTDIVIFDVNSKERIQFTSDLGRDLDPVFSSNGQFVYFASERDGDFAIYKKPLTGGEAVRVDTAGKNAREPIITPDGNHLITLANHGAGSIPTITRIADGAFRTLGKTVSPRSLNLSANGSMLMWIEQESGKNRIVLASVHGSYQETFGTRLLKGQSIDWAQRNTSLMWTEN